MSKMLQGLCSYSILNLENPTDYDGIMMIMMSCMEKHFPEAPQYQQLGLLFLTLSVLNHLI